MNKIKKASVVSLLFLAIIFFLNMLLRQTILKNNTFFFSIENIYLFNFLLSFIAVIMIVFINSKFPDYTGYTFLGFSVLKIGFSIIYLFPLINSELEDKIPDVLNFFFCYFVFLAAESVIVINLLKEEK